MFTAIVITVIDTLAGCHAVPEKKHEAHRLVRMTEPQNQREHPATNWRRAQAAPLADSSQSHPGPQSQCVALEVL